MASTEITAIIKGGKKRKPRITKLQTRFKIKSQMH
jgi:hypothetical protein